MGEQKRVSERKRKMFLGSKVRRLREQVEGLMPLLNAGPGEEAPPPHY